MAHRKRRSDRAGRKALRSPGRPPVARRDELLVFWASIAAGRTSEAAAICAGISPAVGVRWFRRAGGMAPSHLSRSSKPLSGRYLSFAEREEIAILHSQKCGVCEIARRLGRAASTISRELRRNAATRNCGQSSRSRPGLVGRRSRSLWMLAIRAARTFSWRTIKISNSSARGLKMTGGSGSVSLGPVSATAFCLTSSITTLLPMPTSVHEANTSSPARAESCDRVEP